MSVRIPIEKIEQAAVDFEQAVAPLRALVDQYGCEIEVDPDGRIFVACEKLRIPVREWLAVPAGADEGARRRGNVYRRTGRPWHPQFNSDANISLDGQPCADDR